MRESVDQAEALFRDMEITWWAGQAEALRGWLDRGEPFKWFAPYADGPPAACPPLKRPPIAANSPFTPPVPSHQWGDTVPAVILGSACLRYPVTTPFF